MTTFHEPQPQSRRAVRQSERGEMPESPAGFTQFPPADAATAAPQVYSDPNAPREMWDTTARRAAQIPPAAPVAPAVAGRRSAAAQPAPTAEPLTYSTQASTTAPSPAAPSPAVPSYDGPSFRPRSFAVAPAVDAQPPTQAMPAAEQPSYRVRDFSPEGRRAAPVESPGWNIPTPAAQPPAAALDYQTEVRLPEARRPEPPVAPAAFIPALVEPISEVPAALAPRLEQTLTRRELRALQEAEAASSVTAAPAASAPFVAAAAPVAPPVAYLPAAVAPAAPVAPVAPSMPVSAPEPSTNTALTNALAEFDALTREPQRDIEEAPASQWTPPVGHWSMQAGLDDETQPYESTINRTVGSGTVTTSALVLPSIPDGSDIRGPLTGTGEIMLTGSIDLPHAFTSTGATARVEHHGIDALFDLHDAEVVTTDSQPVRAISAVSTHTSGQGVTHTQKPKGTRALTALIISAASMAVVVVGLLVAVFALNIF